MGVNRMTSNCLFYYNISWYLHCCSRRRRRWLS